MSQTNKPGAAACFDKLQSAFGATSNELVQNDGDGMVSYVGLTSKKDKPTRRGRTEELSRASCGFAIASKEEPLPEDPVIECL